MVVGGLQTQAFAWVLLLARGLSAQETEEGLEHEVPQSRPFNRKLYHVLSILI